MCWMMLSRASLASYWCCYICHYTVCSCQHVNCGLLTSGWQDQTDCSVSMVLAALSPSCSLPHPISFSCLEWRSLVSKTARENFQSRRNCEVYETVNWSMYNTHTHTHTHTHTQWLSRIAVRSLFPIISICRMSTVSCSSSTMHRKRRRNTLKLKMIGWWVFDHHKNLFVSSSCPPAYGGDAY